MGTEYEIQKEMIQHQERARILRDQLRLLRARSGRVQDVEVLRNHNVLFYHEGTITTVVGVIRAGTSPPRLVSVAVSDGHRFQIIKGSDWPAFMAEVKPLEE